MSGELPRRGGSRVGVRLAGGGGRRRRRDRRGAGGARRRGAVLPNDHPVSSGDDDDTQEERDQPELARGQRLVHEPPIGSPAVAGLPGTGDTRERGAGGGVRGVCPRWTNEEGAVSRALFGASLDAVQTTDMLRCRA